MACWVYKCNSKGLSHQVDSGDWEWFFNRGQVGRWGTTKNHSCLTKLKPGDTILAYQTDRNELVGVCQMVKFKKVGMHEIVYLKPLERIGKKVRRLKEANAQIAAIDAFQAGPIKTLYEISDDEARVLLDAAGSSIEIESEADTFEEIFIEGEKRTVFSTERNPKLRAEAKNRWGLKCCCCGFDFEQFYGSVAKGLAIVHHLRPFAGTKGKKREATVEDVRVVCANCHFVIHIQNPPIEVEELQRLISKARTPGFESGSSSRGKG